MATRKTSTSPEDFEALEAHLAGTLKRVAPPNGIVQRLQDKITFVQRERITLRLHDWRTLFFVFGGVMSGMLAILTVARAVYHLVGRKHAM
jgi:hypothetical protein